MPVNNFSSIMMSYGRGQAPRSRIALLLYEGGHSNQGMLDMARTAISQWLRIFQFSRQEVLRASLLIRKVRWTNSSASRYPSRVRKEQMRQSLPFGSALASTPHRWPSLDKSTQGILQAWPSIESRQCICKAGPLGPAVQDMHCSKTEELSKETPFPS